MMLLPHHFTTHFSNQRLIERVFRLKLLLVCHLVGRAQLGCRRRGFEGQAGFEAVILE